MEVSSISKTEASIFNSIVRRRRSIYPRQYIPGKKIPDEIIWQILENANRALQVFDFAGFPYKGLSQTIDFSGERGIRTPGGVTLNGFQDRRNRPLCHLSGRKIRV